MSSARDVRGDARIAPPSNLAEVPTGHIRQLSDPFLAVGERPVGRSIGAKRKWNPSNQAAETLAVSFWQKGRAPWGWVCQSALAPLPARTRIQQFARTSRRTA